MPTIEKLEVNATRITAIPALDPVTVITQDHGQGKGKIIIECYGLAWSAYWGGMGNRTVREFFVSCDTEYLHGYLWPGNWPRRRNTVGQEKYLTRIIDAVKAAFKEQADAESAIEVKAEAEAQR